MSNDLLKDLLQLSGAINRHQGGGPPSTSYHPYPRRSRSHTYVNPSYRASQRTDIVSTPTQYIQPTSKDVTIGGVEFKASKNKLLRKDAPSAHSSSGAFIRPPPRPMSNSLHSLNTHFPTHRGSYKPRGARGARNRVLKVNSRRALKQSKQCPFFVKTGTCARGKKCPYQHNPEKIAICPRFLHGDCQFTSETCQLSHDPTPHRTPLCIHFANSGRCKNGDHCVYPHFKVGPRTGVCKDFAVLGYCDNGIDCDKQHLKECPAFAEKGICRSKKCKLPHVIRATAARQKKVSEGPLLKEDKPIRYGISHTTMAPEESSSGIVDTADEPSLVTQDDADYIPLTFEESDDEDYSEESEDDASETPPTF